jgi:SAM-dependent methyltransferase
MSAPARIRETSPNEHLAAILAHTPCLELINRCYRAGVWNFDISTNGTGPSFSSVATLREHLVGTGWFSDEDGTLKPSAEGMDFVVRVGELCRAINRENKQHKIVYEILSRIERGPAVDVGCGPGHSVLRLARLGFGPLYAYELSPVALRMTEALLENNGASAKLFRKDATSLAEIDDSSLALVFSRAAFHYFKQAELAKTLSRALRPGGYFVAEIIGLEYYFSSRHLKTLFHAHHFVRYLSYWRTVVRTFIYELTTLQPRLAAGASEIGYTNRSIRKLARLAGLEIVELLPAPSLRGYLVVMRKPHEERD